MLEGLRGAEFGRFLRAKGPKSQFEMWETLSHAVGTIKVMENLSLIPTQHACYHLAALAWLCAFVVLPSVAGIKAEILSCQFLVGVVGWW